MSPNDTSPSHSSVWVEDVKMLLRGMPWHAVSTLLFSPPPSLSCGSPLLLSAASDPDVNTPPPWTCQG